MVKHCNQNGCSKQAVGKTNLCKAHGGGKRCEYEGCGKTAEGKTNFCVKHGGGKRCEYEGCDKSARSKTEFCVEHGGGKRCEYKGCEKSAQGKTIFCKAHGGGKRCEYEGCDKSAEGKTNFCVKHGGGKRCEYEGCSKSARSKTEFCVEHGGGKRCEYEGCSKSAAGRTNLCIEHGGGKRCEYEGCSKSARSKNLCIEHGGGDRCPNCIDWIDSRSGCKKYDGYCATCFKHVFPTDPRSSKLRVKSAENAVRNYLNENKQGFIHDRPLYTCHNACPSRRRIDHRLEIGGTIIAVETDERQHKSYNQKDEEDRYDDLYMAFSGKWIFIRFNPDSFLYENGHRKNPKLEKRLPVLLAEIERQIRRAESDENKELVEVVKLFFDK